MEVCIDLGIISLTLKMIDYAYADGQGADSDWLCGCLFLSSKRLTLRRPFLTLAPLNDWVEPLKALLIGKMSKVIVSNTEEDFEIVIEADGGDLTLAITISVWNLEKPSSKVEILLPISLSDVEQLQQGLEEASWAFPQRSSW